MPPNSMNPTAKDDKQTRNVILFNQTKKETFTLANGYKSWHRKLRSIWKVLPLKDNITTENLDQAKVFVIASPKEKFTTSEFETLKKFMESGGNVLVLLGEGGENGKTNINFLLEDFGIMINDDAVVRSLYYKYFHPKEALISNGVLNRAVSRAAGKFVPGFEEESEKSSGVNVMSQALKFVYPYGATLNVAKPSTAVLSTGSACIPVNRPILALYHSKVSNVTNCNFSFYFIVVS